MANNDEYPKHLYTATRAEYVTRARVMKKDRGGGCPVAVLMLLAKVAIFTGVLTLVVG